eukprot:scaffold85989_cov64-Phaeocystis_antarctica.AAC.5
MNEGVPRFARCARRRRGVSRRRSLPSSFAERRWRRRFVAELWEGWGWRRAVPSRTTAWRPRLPWPVSSAESLCVRRPILSARRGLRTATVGSRLVSLRRSSGVRLAPPGWLPRGGDEAASPSPSSSASEASSSASRSHSCWAIMNPSKPLTSL